MRTLGFFVLCAMWIAVLIWLTMFAAQAHTITEVETCEDTGLCERAWAPVHDGTITERQEQIDEDRLKRIELEPQAYRGLGSDTERWRPLVASVWGTELTDRALCLMGYESGGNPDAVNPTSGAAGLFQVMPFWWDHYGGDRFDPETNVRVARMIYDQQGWWAWSPYKRGLCR